MGLDFYGQRNLLLCRGIFPGRQQPVHQPAYINPFCGQLRFLVQPGQRQKICHQHIQPLGLKPDVSAVLAFSVNQSCRVIVGLDDCKGCFQFMAGAVSYTHLDVYKRQLSSMDVSSIPIRRNAAAA